MKKFKILKVEITPLSEQLEFYLNNLLENEHLEFLQLIKSEFSKDSKICTHTCIFKVNQLIK